jgi:hypothetical protein
MKDTKSLKVAQSKDHTVSHKIRVQKRLQGILMYLDHSHNKHQLCNNILKY